jgi:DNA repair protein RecO (recombination protein O)
MRWTDEAIVLSSRRHGESALLVHVLTPDHGRHAGLARGGQRPRARVAYQIGNRLLVTWSARLAEHLGVLAGELVHGAAARLIGAPARLACLAAAAALADAALPEREPHPRAYHGLAALLQALEDDAGWAAAYVAWEMDLLAELGFGLDLARCAATGATADLAYVSPRTGRAVSQAAGAPYRDRLLALPAFLGARGGTPAPQDVLDGLALTGFFLDARAFAPHGRKLPAARSRFVDVWRQFATISGR